MTDQYINMDNLAVGYNGKALIHDICIGIEKGEIVTLIGPNGAGKSTILKSITRQLKLISGNVTIAEENLTKLSFRDLSTNCCDRTLSIYRKIGNLKQRRRTKG